MQRMLLGLTPKTRRGKGYLEGFTTCLLILVGVAIMVGYMRISYKQGEYDTCKIFQKQFPDKNINCDW